MLHIHIIFVNQNHFLIIDAAQTRSPVIESVVSLVWFLYEWHSFYRVGQIK